MMLHCYWIIDVIDLESTNQLINIQDNYSIQTFLVLLNLVIEHRLSILGSLSRTCILNFNDLRITGKLTIIRNVVYKQL